MQAFLERGVFALPPKTPDLLILLAQFIEHLAFMLVEIGERRVNFR